MVQAINIAIHETIERRGTRNQSSEMEQATELNVMKEVIADKD
jgi:hypothetical protein